MSALSDYFKNITSPTQNDYIQPNTVDTTADSDSTLYKLGNVGKAFLGAAESAIGDLGTTAGVLMEDLSNFSDPYHVLGKYATTPGVSPFGNVAPIIDYNAAGNDFVNSGQSLLKSGQGTIADATKGYSQKYGDKGLIDRVTDPSYWLSTDGFLTDAALLGGSMVPTLATMAVMPELGVARFAGGLLNAGKVGRLAKLAAEGGKTGAAARAGIKAANLAGRVISSPTVGSMARWAAIDGPMNAAMNAGDIYADLKAQGYSDAEIGQRMRSMMAEELPQDFLTGALSGLALSGKLGRVFGKNPGKLRSFAQNVAINTPIDVASEYWDEANQQRIQNKYTNQPHSESLWDMMVNGPMDDEMAAGASAAAPAVFFGLGGGVRNAIRGPKGLQDNIASGATAAETEARNEEIANNVANANANNGASAANVQGQQVQAPELQTPQSNAGSGNGGASIVADAQPFIGQQMDNGTNGCVEAVTKIGAAHNRFLAKEKANGVVGVDTLVQDAKDSNVPVIPFDESQLQAGDIIVYDGDEANEHVVTYDGNGGYVGNSSKENQVVHKGDYKAMGGFVPSKIIKTGNGNYSGGSSSSANASGGLTKSSGNEQYDAWIQDSAARNGVPANLLSAVLDQESGYNPDARSEAGAIGIAQFMPDTAKGLGIDPTDPQQAIDGAARYLKQNYDEFGNWEQALEAYNGGPGNVGSGETKKYAQEVLGKAGDISGTQAKANNSNVDTNVSTPELKTPKMPKPLDFSALLKSADQNSKAVKDFFASFVEDTMGSTDNVEMMNALSPMLNRKDKFKNTPENRLALAKDFADQLKEYWDNIYSKRNQPPTQEQTTTTTEQNVPTKAQETPQTAKIEAKTPNLTTAAIQQGTQETNAPTNQPVPERPNLSEKSEDKTITPEKAQQAMAEPTFEANTPEAVAQGKAVAQVAKDNNVELKPAVKRMLNEGQPKAIAAAQQQLQDAGVTEQLKEQPKEQPQAQNAVVESKGEENHESKRNESQSNGAQSSSAENQDAEEVPAAGTQDETESPQVKPVSKDSDAYKLALAKQYGNSLLSIAKQRKLKMSDSVAQNIASDDIDKISKANAFLEKELQNGVVPVDTNSVMEWAKRSVDYNNAQGKLSEQPETKKAADEGDKKPAREENGERKLPKLQPKIGVGKDVTVTTDSGKQIKTRYVVLPVDKVITSNQPETMNVNPKYPQELQPRDRQRVSMHEQVDKMAGSLRLEDLTESRNLNQGAPIVRDDGVVLNGNGRALAIKMAFKRKKGKAYRDYILNHGEEYGLSPEDIARLKSAGGSMMLVREVTDNLSDDDVADIINSTTGGSRMGAAEQAKADAGKIRLSDLDSFEPNDRGDLTTQANRDFVRGIINRITSDNERNAYYDEHGNVNADGIQRIKRALFAKAYGNDDLLSKMAESTDDSTRNITNGLTNAAPLIARVNQKMDDGTLPKYPLAKTVSDAVTRYDMIKDSDRFGNINEYLDQQGLFSEYKDSEEVRDLLRALDDYRRSGKKVSRFMRDIGEIIDGMDNPQEGTLAGMSNQPRSLREIIQQAKDEVDNNQQGADLFANAEQPETKKAADEGDKKSVKDKAMEALKPLYGKKITNKATGIVATFSSTGARKMLSNKAIKKSIDNGFSQDEHIEAAKDIKRLYEDAQLSETHLDRNNDPNILSVKRFRINLTTSAGNDATAKITVKETKMNGNKIYSVELEALEKPVELSKHTDITSSTGLGDSTPQDWQVDTTSAEKPPLSTSILPQKQENGERKSTGSEHFDTEPFKHTKTGELIPAAQLKETVERSVYKKKIEPLAKKHNGYYSKIAKRFLFNKSDDKEADRDAFVKEAEETVFGNKQEEATPVQKQTPKAVETNEADDYHGFLDDKTDRQKLIIKNALETKGNPFGDAKGLMSFKSMIESLAKSSYAKGEKVGSHYEIKGVKVPKSAYLYFQYLKDNRIFEKEKTSEVKQTSQNKPKVSDNETLKEKIKRIQEIDKDVNSFDDAEKMFSELVDIAKKINPDDVLGDVVGVSAKHVRDALTRWASTMDGVDTEKAQKIAHDGYRRVIDALDEDSTPSPHKKGTAGKESPEQFMKEHVIVGGVPDNTKTAKTSEEKKQDSIFGEYNEKELFDELGIEADDRNNEELGAPEGLVTGAEARTKHKKELKEKMGKILNRMNANVFFDPEFWRTALELGWMYVQDGYNTGKKLVARLHNDFGDAITPWASAIVETIRTWPADTPFNEKHVTAITKAVGALYEGGTTDRNAIVKRITGNMSEKNKAYFTPMIEASYNGIKKFFDDLKEADANEQQSRQSGNASDGHQSVQTGTREKVDRGEAGEVSGRDGREAEGVRESGNRKDSEGHATGAVSERTVLGEEHSAGTRERGNQPTVPLTPAQENPSPEETPGHDYTIKTSAGNKKSAKERYSQNVKAIQLLKKLESEDRMPTPKEQAVLANYNGWGGLKDAFKDGTKENKELKSLLTDDEYKAARASSLDAFYTPPAIVRAVWKGVSHLGFKGGRVLDPSMGVGNFFGCMPKGMRDGSQLYGVELDNLSSRFARMLYPSASVENKGFQNAHVADNYFDLVISNIPFSQEKISGYQIHNFFFANGMDKVRPGGLMVYITSQGSLTGTTDAARMRQYLAGQADMVGAFKLPSGTFTDAGTDVATDVVIFQKRGVDKRPLPYGQDFLTLKRGPEGYSYYDQYPMNGYFQEHPENILGNATRGTDQFGNNVLKVTQRQGEDVSKALEKAISKLPKNIYEPINRGNQKAFNAKAVAKQARADAKTRDLEYYFKDGKLYQNQDGKAVEITGKGKTTSLLRSYVMLKNDLMSLFDLQRDPNATEAQLDKLRGLLNKDYDAFVKKYGYLNEPSTARVFSQDPDAGTIMALENKLEFKKVRKGKGFAQKLAHCEKADVFTTRTMQPIRTITKADNPSDALLASLQNKGTVDLDYMSQLLGQKPEQIVSALQEKIFKDPNTENYVTRDEYLSGNVREKYAQAVTAAEKDKSYQRNADELKKVIPKDFVPDEIMVNLGTPWVPASDVQDFINNKVLTTGQMRVQYFPTMAKWQVDGYGGSARYSVKGFKSYTDFLNSVLNNKAIEIYDGLKKDGKIDQEAIDAANAVADDLQDGFREWLWSDKERRNRLVRYYNDNYNNTVLRHYDGSHLSFPGKNSNIELRPHQKNVVWRMLQGGNTLIAHCVGAGKTFEMQAAGMEMRRLGIANKPLYCVPNNVVEQFAREFRQLYPNAKLLVIKTGKDLPAVKTLGTKVVTEDWRKKVVKTRLEDLPKAEQQKFLKHRAERNRALARIQTEDWDGIIMSHTMFERLPLTPETVAGYIKDQLSILEQTIIEAHNGRVDGRTLNSLETRKKTLQNRIEEAMNMDLKDIGIPFEQLGIDQIFVDEADLFKNLHYESSIGGVSGLTNSDANRSNDMYVKTQWLTSTHNGRGVVFATGTPISNTIAELYTMMRYLDPRGLKEKGLTLFDNWIRTFAEIGPGIERKPTGDGFRKVNRVKNFINMADLTKMFRKFADIKTQDELKLKIPKLKNGKSTVVALDADPYIISYIKNEVPKRLADIKKNAFQKAQNGEKQDNMLSLTNDLRHMTMTDAKINACADKIAETFKRTSDIKGAQLVFCDYGIPKAENEKAKDSDIDSDADTDDTSEVENKQVYTRLMDAILARGIPEDQVAFVQSAKNKEEQAELFQKVDRGEIRVLIGSTQKMGAGTNCQHHLVALHDLDAPWRPRDLEQRHGRILRQGNPNKEVEIFNYVVKDSFDANMWEKLKNKAAIIAQAMSENTGVRVVEDADLVTLSYAEVEGAATGNPLVKKQLSLKNEVTKLTHASTLFNRRQQEAETKVNQLPEEIQEEQTIAEKIQADIKARKDTHGDKFSMTLGGKTYDKRADATVALDEIAKGLTTAFKEIGSIGGMRIKAMKGSDGTHYQIIGKRAYQVATPSVPGIENTLNSAPEKALANHQARAKKLSDDLKIAQETLQEQNPYTEKLKKATVELKDVARQVEQSMLNNGRQQATKADTDSTPVQKQTTSDYSAEADTGERVERTMDDIVDEIKQTMPYAKSVEHDGTRVTVTMPNNTTVQFDVRDVIELNDADDARVRKENAIPASMNVRVNGSVYTVNGNGFVELARDGRIGTAAHELVHIAQQLYLNDKEMKALHRGYDKVAERTGRDFDEVIADAGRDLFLRKVKYTNYNKIFRKLWQGIDALRDMFNGVYRANKVLRSIVDTNEVFERTPGTQERSDTRYSAEKKDEETGLTMKEKEAPKSWFNRLTQAAGAKLLGLSSEQVAEIQRTNAKGQTYTQTYNVSRKSPNVIVQQESDSKAMTGRHWFASPSRLAKKYPRFGVLYNMADKAMTLLTDNRDHYNKMITDAEKLCKSKEDREKLSDICFTGDEEEHEFTREELEAEGVNDNVIKAYMKIRAMARALYKLVDEAYRRKEYHTRHLNKLDYERLLKMRDKGLATILRDENGGEDKNGNALRYVQWSQPHTWDKTYYGANDDTLKRFENDNAMLVLNAKQREDGLYDVRVRESIPPLTNRTGYIPHYFFEHMLRVVDKDGNYVRDELGRVKTLGSARTRREAVKLADDIAANPDKYGLKKGENIVVEDKTFDFARLGMDSHQTSAIMSEKDYYAAMKKLAKDTRMTPEEMRKELKEIGIRKTNKHRFYGSTLKRKGVKGYTKDLDYVLRHWANSAVRYHAMETAFKPKAISYYERMYGAYEMEPRIEEARFAKEYIGDINGNPTATEQWLTGQLMKCKAFRYFVVPRYGERAALTAASKISNITSQLCLGFWNVSSALLNLTQVINVAAYTGNWRDIGRCLAKGVHRHFGYTNVRGTDIRYNETRVLAETGVLHDIGMDSGAGYDKSRLTGFGKASMSLFKISESTLRIGAVLAAYEEGRRRGMSHSEAIAFAKDINRKSNFDYSVADAPNIFRRGSLISQLVLQFKKYGFKELEVMADMLSSRTNIKQKAIFWSLYFLSAGLLGFVPGGDWLDEKIFDGQLKLGIEKTIGNWAGDSWIGKLLGRIALFGAGSIVNADVSRRAGISDVVPTRLDLSTVAGAGLGKIGALAVDTPKMLADLSDANVAQVVRDVSPGIYNILAATVWGQSYGKRGRTNSVYDSIGDRILRGMGFSSVDERLDADVPRIIQMDKAELSKKQQEAIDRYIDDPTSENKAKYKELGVTDKRIETEKEKKGKTRLERALDNVSKEDKRSGRYNNLYLFAQ